MVSLAVVQRAVAPRLSVMGVGHGRRIVYGAIRGLVVQGSQLLSGTDDQWWMLEHQKALEAGVLTLCHKELHNRQMVSPYISAGIPTHMIAHGAHTRSAVTTCHRW